MTLIALAVFRLITNSNLTGLFDREIAGISPLQYLVDVTCRAPPQIDIVGTIAHQAAGFDNRPEFTNRG
jgi:hypothetical protein